MAQMIPAAVPPGATSGEKALFKILAALPEDDFVYYDVQIKHRYAENLVSQLLGGKLDDKQIGGALKMSAFDPERTFLLTAPKKTKLFC